MPTNDDDPFYYNGDIVLFDLRFEPKPQPPFTDFDGRHAGAPGQGRLFDLPSPKLLVFLDFDGVFFTPKALEGSCTADDDSYNVTDGFTSTADPVVMRFLNELCAPISTAVVVTSSWKVMGINEALGALRSAGYTGRIHRDWRTRDPGNPEKRRGNGIQQWLGAHPETENFVIIDDDLSFHLTEHLPHLVPCHGTDGLGYYGMRQAMHILHDKPLDPFEDDRWEQFKKSHPNELLPIIEYRKNKRLRQIRLSRISRFKRNNQQGATLPQLTRHKKGGPQPA